MGASTSIEWCHHTFNPWVGCTKVSAGCAHCYAEVDTPARVSAGRGLPLWGPMATRQIKAESGWSEPLRWFRAAVRSGRRRRVFCASQGDVFENRRDLDAARARMWAIVEQTIASGPTSRWVDGISGDAKVRWLFGDNGPLRGGGLDWLLLTKRPENIKRLIPERWRSGLPPNVWVGASVENQEAADERVPHLLRVPARVRFLSLEPLLGPVDLDRPTCPSCGGHDEVLGDDNATGFCREHGDEMALGAWLDPCANVNQPGINWLIIGGESGPSARPCDLAWIRDLRDQGRAAGVPVFVKQLGAAPFVRVLGLYDETRPLNHLKHPKGGDPAEWPEDLRVREVPGELHGEHCPGAACALPPEVCRRVHRPLVAAPRSVGPGTPEEQARMRGCDRNHLHSMLMLGRVCACGYEGRA